MNTATYVILALTIFIFTIFGDRFFPQNTDSNETKFILPEEFNLIDIGEYLFVKEIYRNPQVRMNIDSIEFGFVTDPYIYIPHPYLGTLKIDYMRREIFIKRQGSVITGFPNNLELNNWLAYKLNPQTDYGTK